MPAESPARSACRPLRPTLRVSGVSRVFRVFRFPGFLWSLEFLGFLELLGFFMCFRALGFEDLKVIGFGDEWWRGSCGIEGFRVLAIPVLVSYRQRLYCLYTDGQHTGVSGTLI